MYHGAGGWRECLKSLSIARSLALGWGARGGTRAPALDFQHRRIYARPCAGMSGVLPWVGRPRAALNVNSIYAADGGANFDARVCIELPWRHDSSEKKALPRAWARESASARGAARGEAGGPLGSARARTLAPEPRRRLPQRQGCTTTLL